MRPRRDITPYMGSSDIDTNASITLWKLFKRIRSSNPAYRPSSRYQMRLKHRRAARRAVLHIVR